MNGVVLVLSLFKLISNGDFNKVLVPLITLKSLFNYSRFKAYTAFPIHLFSWNNEFPPAVWRLENVTLPRVVHKAPVVAGL